MEGMIRAIVWFRDDRWREVFVDSDELRRFQNGEMPSLTWLTEGSLPLSDLFAADVFVDIGQMLEPQPKKPSFLDTEWFAASVQEVADFLRDMAQEWGIDSPLIAEIESEGRSGRGSRIRVINYLELLELPPGIIRWPL